MTGKKVCVDFGVANAIGGVGVKLAGWDYWPMLPRVCSHIETIKRNFVKFSELGDYYYDRL